MGRLKVDNSVGVAPRHLWVRDVFTLPANEAYRDNTRKELDHRVLIDMQGLPESILEPLDLLRLKW